MDVAFRQIGDVAVVALRGPRLDADAAIRLKEELVRHAAPEAKIALDMAEVRSIDAVGCGAVVGLQKQIDGRGGKVKVFALHPRVRTLFQMARLHRHLEVYNHQAEAVQSFAVR